MKRGRRREALAPPAALTPTPTPTPVVVAYTIPCVAHDGATPCGTLRVPNDATVFYSVVRQSVLRCATCRVDAVDVLPTDDAVGGVASAHPRYAMTLAEAEALAAQWPEFSTVGIAGVWCLAPDGGDGTRALTTVANPPPAALLTLERALPLEAWLVEATSQANPPWRRGACASFAADWRAAQLAAERARSATASAASEATGAGEASAARAADVSERVPTSSE